MKYGVDPRVSHILELLKDSRRQSVKLEQLSSSCNLSCSRADHLFKQYTGMTPTRYLKRLKLIRARELMERSFYTVKEVAVMAGFSDVSHFVRDYKAHFGQTPTETRRSIALRTGSTNGQQIADSAKR